MVVPPLCGTDFVGYLNSVGGTVNTILGKIYPETYPDSTYSRNISSIVFAGTVLGQLSFGYMSDKLGRKFGMISATIIVVVFSALSAGAYGAGGSTGGMLAALAAYRFLLGIGIGAEYPAGSVAASEATSEAKKGHRHALFVMVTNFVIDFGFVLGGFVPLVLLVSMQLYERY
jgi:MFS family permease